MPALGRARAWRRRRARPPLPATRSHAPPLGMCGESCRPPTRRPPPARRAIRRAWMIAKRRFMADERRRRGGLAGSCSYPARLASPSVSYPLRQRYRSVAALEARPFSPACTPRCAASPPPGVRAGRRRGAAGRQPDAAARGARAARGGDRAASRSSTRGRPTASCSAAPGTSARTTPSWATPERWFDQDDLTGWTAIRVPHNWNATRHDARTRPRVGWYRKEFTLPRVAEGRGERTSGRCASRARTTGRRSG